MLNYFPARIKKQTDGMVTLTMVNFPKVSMTSDTVAWAAQMILPLLHNAIFNEIVKTKAFPVASPPKRGQVMIRVPANSFIKLQMHLLIHRRGLTMVQLMGLLDRSEKQVRNLLNINYATRMTELDYAVDKLGGTIGVIVDDQALLGG